MDKPKLQLYGTDWCPKSAALRNHLQRNCISFEDFNVEVNTEAADTIREIYDGKLKFPTLLFEKDFIKNPTIPQLNEFLKKHHIE